MVASPPGGASIYRQKNTGSGTFVGRHNFGKIEMVDAKTKAVLDKLSIEAPALADLLSKALRDGLISPDTAFALEMAARNINGDVAEALYTAGRNINQDVAEALMCAGQNINEHVARQITTAADQLEWVASQLNQAQVTVQSLSTVAREVGDLDTTVQALEAASQNIAMAASAVSNDDWSWHSFRWGRFWCFIGIAGLLALFAYATR
jgi:hypothetical protein